MTISATKRGFRRLFAALLLLLFSGGFGVRAEEPDVSVTVLPFRYAGVDGDEEKFRAHHWMKEGFVAGVSEASAGHRFQNGASLTLGGHALVDQNDLGAEIALAQEGLWFARLDFSEFRKYYDGTGGTYHFFSTLQSNDTDKELALDIGRLGLETGLTLEGWPELSFLYEREFKDGAKSRLTWAAVKEGTTTRSTAPSWQEVDETVDSFAVKARHTLAGFDLQGEQRWEFARAETLREERSLSTTSAAADKKIRRQDQAPESNLLTTTLNAQRNFLGERLFFSSGYRFAHLDNREFESIIESNAGGVPTNFSNPKQIRDARADNDYDSHTWVGSLTASPWKGWSILTRLKAEVIRRESSSSYPADASPNSAGGSTPDGVIDQRVASLNENKALRFGEALSLRWTGLPRTALYTELELEQARVRVTEDRKDLLGVNAGETFSRTTITDVDRFHAALGGLAHPFSFVTLNSQVGWRRNNNDYDDQRETDSTGTTARSAFFDGQRVETTEWSTRAAFRPKPWLNPSLRYQLRSDAFNTRAEAERSVETRMRSHILTADVTLQPAEPLLTTFSYSRQLASTTTPARYATTGTTPTFRGDVDTWLMSADYACTRKLNFTGTALYSRADNFNDFADAGLPLGMESEQVDLTAGLNYRLGEDSTFSTRYGFYHYLANSSADTGDYDAHVVWLEGSRKF